jgi:hypothetical protein
LRLRAREVVQRAGAWLDRRLAELMDEKELSEEELRQMMQALPYEMETWVAQFFETAGIMLPKRNQKNALHALRGYVLRLQRPAQTAIRKRCLAPITRDVVRECVAACRPLVELKSNI